MEQLRDWSFSEAEIEEQLRALGYCGVPAHRLRLFKRDLDQLILHEKSSSSQWTDSSSCSQLLMAPQDAQQDTQRQFSAVGSSAQPDHQVPSYEDDNVPHSRRECNQHTCCLLGARNDSLSSRNPETQCGASRQLVHKQKFTRKRACLSRMSSDSILSTESLSGLEEQIEGLQVSTSCLSDDSYGSDTASSSSHPHTSTAQYRSRIKNNIPTCPKSFIQPQFENPHNRNLKKTDPVAKYFQYKQHWETFKVPGENKWTELRREIRDQMVYKDQPLPNLRRRCQNVTKTTVVPTEKKRLALRWKVRHDLANGVIPAKFTYPF